MKSYLRKHVWWKVCVIYMVICSIFIGTFTHQAYSESSLLNADAISTVDANTSNIILRGIPVRITVPSISLDLPIVAGTYDSRQQSWSVSDIAANYATNTYKPNSQTGRTLIYGHDRDKIFHKLKELGNGAEVILSTKEGHVFTYRYALNSAHDVQPNDTSIFSHLNSPEPQLILMTCDGFWSQERRIMVFNLEKAQ